MQFSLFAQLDAMAPPPAIAPEEPRIYRAVSWAYEHLVAEIEKLNKRAVKLGVALVALVEVDRVTTMVPDPRNPKVKNPVTHIRFTVEGGTPRLEGWAFVAKIEPTAAGNLVKLLPGVTSIPIRYYTAGTNCDHCRKTRYRTETFIVRHQDGRYCQLGRSCLADFLGGKSVEMLASIAEWSIAIAGAAESAEGHDSYGRGWDIGEPTGMYVATVAAFARFEGYASRKDVESGKASVSTASQAWRYLRPSQYDQDWLDKIRARGFEIEERDIAIADKAIAWAKQLDTTDNNFHHNLRVSATLEHTDSRSQGIVSAIIGCYLREVEREAIARKRDIAGKSLAYLGTIGKREIFSGITIAGWREFEADFGVRTMIRFLDTEGNLLVWWTSERPDWVTEGAEVAIKATVKKHDTYRDEKQTIINRVTLAGGLPMA